MVFIKKVTMKGFKSYGPRKVAVTMSPGFTCIVGPNGSGKSNVVDAVAFVIGMQSSKQLRAGVFSDLIYGGSKKIKASRFAEASIHFDNSDKKLPVDAEEVIVSRSIDTSGKTVYRVNKKRETRTYVVDLLAHADIFPEGHNIVMQGDITQFIKMSAEERRGIIEEISGIAEYNEKRERGQRELDRANENIARVELVLNEVSSRLQKLEREKNDATRYRELKDDIYRHKGWLVKGELKSARASLLRNQESTGAQIEKKASCDMRIEELERLLSQAREELDATEREIESLSEERQVALAREMEELRGKERMLASEDAHVTDATRALETQREAVQRQRGELDDERVSLEERAGSLREGLERDVAILREKEGEHEKIIEGLSQSQEALDSLRRELEETEHSLSDMQGSLFSLRTNAERASSEIAFAEQKKREYEEILDTVGKERDDARTSLEEARQKNAVLKARLEELEEECARARDEEGRTWDAFNGAEAEFLKKRLRISELEARINAGKEREAIRTNLGAGVADILDAKERGEIEGIRGTVASLGTTDEEYKSALEVAAGNRMNNVVVDTDEVARKCVSYLKERKSGRATFLPLNTIQGFAPREHQYAGDEGVVDYAINLIRFEAQFSSAFRYVFGDTLVVKTMEDTKKKRERMVTLDGDLVEKSGAITGGLYIKARYLSSFSVDSVEKECASLARDIELLAKEKEEHRATLVRLKERIAETEKKIAETEKACALLLSKGENEERILGQKEGEEKSLKEKMGALLALTSEKGRERDELAREIALKEKELPSLDARKRELSGRLSFGGIDLGAYEGEMAALRERISQGEREYQEALGKAGFLKERIDALGQTLAEIAPSLATQHEKAEALKAQREEIEGALKRKLEEERSFSAVLQGKREQRDGLRTRLEEYRKEKESLKEETYAVASRLDVLASHKSEGEQRLAELEEEASHYQVEGDYKDLKELRFRIQSMEHEKESLEPINMRAIEEYDEVLARHSLLATRTEKLYEERKSILDFIAEVEGQKKSVFMSTFSQVADNFSKIFSELSPEGTARLSVENDEDPFAGGIDLEANPGGKEVKRVEAMSGGEKALTALAFVFAIQRFKPAPFYILDEIDMHLDDVNCKRVAEMVKQSSKTTQFVIITLRDVMMAAAELLYGVTIKSGLSKILSVKLEEIAEYKEPLPTVEG